MSGHQPVYKNCKPPGFSAREVEQNRKERASLRNENEKLRAALVTIAKGDVNDSAGFAIAALLATPKT